MGMAVMDLALSICFSIPPFIHVTEFDWIDFKLGRWKGLYGHPAGRLLWDPMVPVDCDKPDITEECY